MTRSNGQRVSDLLREFYTATTDASADQALENLVLNCIEPTIRSTLRSRIATYYSRHVLTAEMLDSVELVSDIEAQVIRELQSRRTGTADRTEIWDLTGYVRAAAINRFHQYIREKYPERFRLKNKIIYILEHSDGVGIRVNSSGRRMFGTADMLESKIDGPERADRDEIARLVKDSKVFFSGLGDNQPLIIIVRSVAARISAPAEVDALTAVIAEHAGISDAAYVSDLETVLRESGTTEPDQQTVLEEHAELEAVWNGILALTLEQRTAVLLNLRGVGGENALTYLPILRIASLTLIAEALEIDVEELTDIWHELPLDDNAIAERLGVTRQKVINLRQGARKKLRNMMSGRQPQICD